MISSSTFPFSDRIIVVIICTETIPFHLFIHNIIYVSIKRFVFILRILFAYLFIVWTYSFSFRDRIVLWSHHCRYHCWSLLSSFDHVIAVSFKRYLFRISWILLSYEFILYSFRINHRLIISIRSIHSIVTNVLSERDMLRSSWLLLSYK